MRTRYLWEGRKQRKIEAKLSYKTKPRMTWLLSLIELTPLTTIGAKPIFPRLYPRHTCVATYNVGDSQISVTFTKTCY